mmetsp:Transcript_20485/g.46630  ORF Transcript_20485/g.46630 Transcript_20485/m.46630 type:complete len:308 (+) Transcript_20485:445-1368(+)
MELVLEVLPGQLADGVSRTKEELAHIVDHEVVLLLLCIPERRLQEDAGDDVQDGEEDEGDVDGEGDSQEGIDVVQGIHGLPPVKAAGDALEEGEDRAAQRAEVLAEACAVGVESGELREAHRRGVDDEPEQQQGPDERLGGMQDGRRKRAELVDVADDAHDADHLDDPQQVQGAEEAEVHSQPSVLRSKGDHQLLHKLGGDDGAVEDVPPPVRPQEVLPAVRGHSQAELDREDDAEGRLEHAVLVRGVTGGVPRHEVGLGADECRVEDGEQDGGVVEVGALDEVPGAGPSTTAVADAEGGPAPTPVG